MNSVGSCLEENFMNDGGCVKDFLIYALTHMYEWMNWANDNVMNARLVRGLLNGNIMNECGFGEECSHISRGEVSTNNLNVPKILLDEWLIDWYGFSPISRGGVVSSNHLTYNEWI